ncbi:MAG: MmgE/PrpD family protein [Burkholderiales bacterium]|nr:MmgE/PrpD family protein [Burkholderiales bacterium]
MNVSKPYRTSMTTTTKLAQYMVGVKPSRLPPGVLDDAALAVLDLLGVAAAGSRTHAAACFRQAGSVLGSGNAPIWFSGITGSDAASVSSNAVAGSALDLDDGERSASGHPGAGVIPVAIAVAARENRSWADCLAAISVGYEVGTRIAASRDARNLPTLATGRWMSFATAATTAWLMRLDETRFAHALAIAGTLAPNMAANGYSKQTGNSIKEGISWSAVTGMTAAFLAASGATGPLDVLDHPQHFDASRVLQELGETWSIQRNYFKLYSCCRWAHAAIDAVLQMRASESWIKDAQSIDVFTFERALRLNNSPEPANIEAAQYSVPFCVALASIHGPDAMLVLNEDVLKCEATRSLAKRVRLHNDPEMTALFPASTPARVVVSAGGVTMQRTVLHCRGDWQNRPSLEELLAKYRRLYGMLVRQDKCEAIARAVIGMREESTVLIAELLR